MPEEPIIDLDVTVGDGKYQILFPRGGELHCLRHGKPWPARDLNGDNLVLALTQEVQKLRDENAMLVERVHDLEETVEILGDEIDCLKADLEDLEENL